MKFIKKISKSKKSRVCTNERMDMEGRLKSTLKDNIELVKETLGESSDIIIKEFQIGEEGEMKIGLFYIEGLADKTLIQEFILKVLMLDIRKVNFNPSFALEKSFPKILKDFVLPAGEINNISDFEDLYNHLLSGNTIILVDEYTQGYVVSSKGWEDRGIQESQSQTVVRGPKDSFSETLGSNMASLRRRIKDTNLRIEIQQIGRRTNTDVAIVYIKDIANNKILQEVRKRLDNIDIDAILESCYIEEFIQDKTYTVFPTVYNTERPDAVAAGLLEGRIAILIDGTPFVLMVPALFVHFLQSPEDYYQRFDISTLIRILRYISFFIALLTPSMYIAITTFHQEMLPTTLLMNIASQREGVPFPAVVEALLMEIVFEILREAGIRMPRAIGPAISIVGALVLGEAAVKAGIVSPVMVIVVSITAISSFVFPTYNMAAAVRILRFGFMIFAASFGLYGISILFIAMLLHLNSLCSFGVPYMSPMAPFNLDESKDVVLRFPIWRMLARPHLISQGDRIRQQRHFRGKQNPAYRGK